jgi:hypothetical protein
MAKLDAGTWPEDSDVPGAPAASQTRVNVAGKLRGMW